MQKEPKKIEELNKWLSEFELAKSVSCELLAERKDILKIELKSFSGETSTNFADACFSVSQLLPILVQGINAEEGDIIMCEQPEVHLNPILEAKLSEFFLYVVENKKAKFLIESHSEHLFMRLRTLIKAGDISPERVAVYYSEIQNGRSSTREIVLDKDGKYDREKWPKGFFDQALIEGLRYAGTKPRKLNAH